MSTPQPQADDPAKRGVLSTTFRAFQYRNFRLMWTGAFTSTSGYFVQEVAQSWLVYHADRLALPARADSVPQRSADSAALTIWRCCRGPHGPPQDLGGLAIHPNAGRGDSGRLAVAGRDRSLAYHGRRADERLRTSFRRAGLPGAYPFSRGQERFAERGRADVDPIQSCERHREADRRRCLRGCRSGGLLCD